MKKSNVTTRLAASRKELLKVEGLQREIFKFSPTETVGANELTAFQHNGGAVFVAMDDFENKTIGFAFGFPSIYRDQPCYHSVMFGVLPEYRLKGAGYQLLLEQRNYLKIQRIELSTVYVDPLDGITSHLCIRKLRGVGSKYFRNIFGSNLGGINAGEETDRVLVEWQIDNSNQSVKPITAQTDLQDKHYSNISVINRTLGKGIFREIVDYRLDLHDPSLLVELPGDFQTIKSKDIGLASSWRTSIREIIETYLDYYSIVGFYSENMQARRNFFILEESLPS